MASLRNHQLDLTDPVSQGFLGFPFLLSAPLHRGLLKSQYLPCHLLGQVRLWGLEDTSAKSSKKQSSSEDEKQTSIFFHFLQLIFFKYIYFILNYTINYHGNNTSYTVLSLLNNRKALMRRKNVVLNPCLREMELRKLSYDTIHM